VLAKHLPDLKEQGQLLQLLKMMGILKELAAIVPFLLLKHKGLPFGAQGVPFGQESLTEGLQVDEEVLTTQKSFDDPKGLIIGLLLPAGPEKYSQDPAVPSIFMKEFRSVHPEPLEITAFGKRPAQSQKNLPGVGRTVEQSLLVHRKGVVILTADLQVISTKDAVESPILRIKLESPFKKVEGVAVQMFSPYVSLNEAPINLLVLHPQLNQASKGFDRLVVIPFFQVGLAQGQQ